MNSVRDPNWLALAIEDLELQGYAVIMDVLDRALLERTRSALYTARDGVVAAVGTERLERAGELGVMRVPFLFSDVFFEYLHLAPLLALIDATLGPTAIVHLMNGFILPPTPASRRGERIFQQTFHRDFPRYLNGYLASINVFFAIDDFTQSNGATLVVPGSHQQPEAPDVEYMKARAVPILAGAGSVLLFDSTLWHAAGQNTSDNDRLAINIQLTRSYLKQQVDYVRALGAEKILTLPDRSQQLLGWYTRVVTSLDEYYQPPEKRLYRAGQG